MAQYRRQNPHNGWRKLRRKKVLSPPQTAIKLTKPNVHAQRGMARLNIAQQEVINAPQD